MRATLTVLALLALTACDTLGGAGRAVQSGASEMANELEAAIN